MADVWTPAAVPNPWREKVSTRSRYPIYDVLIIVFNGLQSTGEVRAHFRKYFTYKLFISRCYLIITSEVWNSSFAWVCYGGVREKMKTVVCMEYFSLL